MSNMKKLKLDELNRLSINDFKNIPKNPIVVVLDSIRSLNNIGSVFRTSDAFLIEKILLCGITGTPPHRDIEKTALGATETVNWEYHSDIVLAINQLKNDGFIICAIEQAQGSIWLHNFEVENNKKYALVFGNEVFGVSDEVMQLSDFCIEIPQFGSKHSLNISVSAGIVLWEFAKKIGN